MLKFLLVVILLAIAIYLTVRVIQRRGGPAGHDQTPARPFGPDDDDDFLRELGHRKRHPQDPDA